MQKTELADAPASTFAKTVKSIAKPRKKSSPLDDIRKDPDALYALLKMISKEKEATDAEDERWLQKTLSTPTIRSGLDVMKKKLMIQ